ncbi:hypothetical protein I6G77_18080 [Bacillus tropicus]|uniref:Uncharacterized protein n=1 Tax=Bacillus tropicus TaxID=2026188 RepID=A0A7T2V322_9BACI|nr:hypothetical protein [Bacillus tropicus]QPR75995.1 hypothetical protein I6G77_18080 [Bacillus tropicus]
MNEERSQQQPTTMTPCDTPAAAMIPCSVIAYMITYDSMRSDSDRLSSCFENTFYYDCIHIHIRRTVQPLTAPYVGPLYNGI